MNPFLINAYREPYLFCDRVSEIETLMMNIKNQSHTTFFAQRRIGKTALIRHLGHLLEQKKQAFLYIDIYSTQNLKDFSNILANAIYQSFPEKQSIGKKFWQAITSLRPVISADEVSGTPQLSLDITHPDHIERTVPQILNFLDSQNKPIVIAIDEFQQILNYPEQNVEAILRTSIQTLKNISFIFSGSHQHMMHEIFNNHKRPFYAGTKSINLQKIDAEIYSEFILRHFTQHKFKVDPEALSYILELTDGHTYYTQRLCHEVFNHNVKKVNRELVAEVMRKIIRDHEAIFFQYRNLVTPTQWKLMKAVATEHKVYQPYAQAFIYKYELGTSANVKRTLLSMVDKELIHHQSVTDQPYYEINDKFLRFWLEHKR